MSGCCSPSPSVSAPTSGRSCGCTAATPQPAKISKPAVLIDCCGVAIAVPTVPVLAVPTPLAACNYGCDSHCPNSVPSFPAGVNEYISRDSGKIVFNY